MAYILVHVGKYTKLASFFETGSHYAAKASLEFTVKPRLALNWQ